MTKGAMLVNITLPVFNEEVQLEKHTKLIVDFATKHLRFPFEVVIADNGSTDETSCIANALSRSIEVVKTVRLNSAGRGSALNKAWSMSHADIVSYMDIDLSADLAFFPLLVESIASQVCDICVGSRALRPDLVQRGHFREFLSVSYNRLLRSAFSCRFRDAQCGFKALSRNACDMILPLVQDKGWFFDTELLLLAEKLQLNIYELPVAWHDDSHSTVKIGSTVIADLRGIVRMYKAFKKPPFKSREDSGQLLALKP